MIKESKGRKKKIIKAVCRKLPPELTEAVFVKTFSKYFEKALFFYYTSGFHKYFWEELNVIL